MVLVAKLFGKNPLRVQGRQNRQAERQNAKMEHREVVDRLKNMPQENLLRLAKAAQQAHQEQYGGGADDEAFEAEDALGYGMTTASGDDEPRLLARGEGVLGFGFSDPITVLHTDTSGKSFTFGPKQSTCVFRPSLMNISDLPDGMYGQITSVRFDNDEQLAGIYGAMFSDFSIKNLRNLAIQWKDIFRASLIQVQGIIYPVPGTSTDVTLAVGVSFRGKRLA